MTNTIINVFYYDSDYFDVNDVVALRDYLKQSLPSDTIILCLPEDKVRLEQYPLEIKEIITNDL